MSFMLDQCLEEHIRRAIVSCDVSVQKQYEEQTTTYHIVSDDGNIYELEFEFLYSDKDVKFYEYTIFVNFEEFASTIISDRTRAYSPKESSILKLFKMCSDKVIYQEMQSAVHNRIIRIGKEYQN